MVSTIVHNVLIAWKKDSFVAWSRQAIACEDVTRLGRFGGRRSVLEQFASAARNTFVSRHYVDRLTAPLKPLNTIMPLWCSDGFQGCPEHTWLPRDATPSGSYAPVLFWRWGAEVNFVSKLSPWGLTQRKAAARYKTRGCAGTSHSEDSTEAGFYFFVFPID